MGNSQQLVEVINKSNEVNINEYYRMSKNARNFAENNFEETGYLTNLIKIYKTVLAEHQFK